MKLWYVQTWTKARHLHEFRMLESQHREHSCLSALRETASRTNRSLRPHPNMLESRPNSYRGSVDWRRGAGILSLQEGFGFEMSNLNLRGCHDEGLVWPSCLRPAHTSLECPGLMGFSVQHLGGVALELAPSPPALDSRCWWGLQLFTKSCRRQPGASCCLLRFE